MIRPKTPWNKNRALLEGWDIFEDDGRGLTIMRVDDPASVQIVGMPKECVFPSDAEALFHVVRRAAQGSRFHREAILRVIHQSPCYER